jgi:hypothetical protein
MGHTSATWDLPSSNEMKTLSVETTGTESVDEQEAVTNFDFSWDQWDYSGDLLDDAPRRLRLILRRAQPFPYRQRRLLHGSQLHRLQQQGTSLCQLVEHMEYLHGYR